jgi:hypothetical protein
MAIEHAVKDKTRLTYTETGPADKLVIENNHSAYFRIKSDREFFLRNFNIGPGGRTFDVEVSTNLVDNLKDPRVPGAVKTDIVLAATTTIYSWNSDLNQIYRGDVIIKITNKHGSDQIYYINVFSYDGPEMPLRKY